MVSGRLPYDPPPAPVVGARPEEAAVRKVGVVEAEPADELGVGPQGTSSAIVTISGGFKTIAASNTTIQPNGLTLTATPIDPPTARSTYGSPLPTSHSPVVTPYTTRYTMR